MRRCIVLVGVIAIGCGESRDSADTDVTTSNVSATTVSTTVAATATDPTGTTLSATSPSDDTSPPDTGLDGSDDGSSSGGEIPGTLGCGIAATDATQTWVQHDMEIEGVPRPYWVWLPEPYDPDRRYPVVYQFHGCSDGEDRQNNNPPVQDYSGADAIVIRGRAVDSCWDSNPSGPDVLFFDALVADVETNWCADPARRLLAGYSSGSFMSHALACVRGDMVRGVATIAGGQPGSDCPGEVGALLIHDLNDSTVAISASETTRDALLARNGCNVDVPTTPVDPAPCHAYAECDEGYPVIWCQTEGQDHSRQDSLAAPAFWSFLSGLPTP